MHGELNCCPMDAMPDEVSCPIGTLDEPPSKGGGSTFFLKRIREPPYTTHERNQIRAAGKTDLHVSRNYPRTSLIPPR